MGGNQKTTCHYTCMTCQFVTWNSIFWYYLSLHCQVICMLLTVFWWNWGLLQFRNLLKVAVCPSVFWYIQNVLCNVDFFEFINGLFHKLIVYTQVLYARDIHIDLSLKRKHVNVEQKPITSVHVGWVHLNLGNRTSTRDEAGLFPAIISDWDLPNLTGHSW